MKSISHALLMLVTFGTFLAAAVVPGPNGGRVFDWGDQKFEFVAKTDGKIALTLFDAKMKVIPPKTQWFQVVAEAPSGKVTIPFTISGQGFASTIALPEGKGYRLIIQAKTSSEGKPQNFRLDLNLEKCGECKRAEYACACAH